MDIKTTRTASCAVCGKESQEGIVITLDKKSHFLSVDFEDLQSFRKERDDPQEFICTECIEEMKASSFVQFMKDGLKVIEDSVSSDDIPFGKTVPSAPDIINKMEELLKTLPFVTTLEVKNDLRAEDYWVDQSQVSHTMDIESRNNDNLDFSVSPEGHRYYFDPNKKVMVKNAINGISFNFESVPSPMHIMETFVGVLATLWELSQADVLSVFNDSTPDEVEEFLDSGKGNDMFFFYMRDLGFFNTKDQGLFNSVLTYI